ncbi:MAG TPA: YciI family protein [Opitutaceae bacterium]|nr:YciI family protein [Opitutaceae bacterium]
MENKTSPYLLIFRDASPDVYTNLSADQRQQLMHQWNAWYDGLAEQGKVEHGNPLEASGRTVSGVRGERVVDGPFAEAKEAIGGYFFLRVASLDEATEIAQRCPSLKHGMTVEVRPVADACHALGVKGRPAKRETANA